MNNLLLDIKDNIALVTINRPKALNALNSETLSELYQCFCDLDHNNNVKIVIITGAGDRSFVAGADLKEVSNASPIENYQMSLLAQKAFGVLETLSKPTIAAVNGFALGGGCELSMSCDIRIASEKAKFGQPETGLGLIPSFSGTQRLSRLVGIGRAKELIFSCETIDAQEAHRIGLVNHICQADELLQYCYNLAYKISSNGPLAIALSKKAINASVDVDITNGLALEASLFGLACASKDKIEGVSAFIEKRKDKKFVGK